jgi:hypothetical protein
MIAVQAIDIAQRFTIFCGSPPPFQRRSPSISGLFDPAGLSSHNTVPSQSASILGELVFGHIVDHSRIVAEGECCPKSNLLGLIGPVAEYKFVRLA